MLCIHQTPHHPNDLKSQHHKSNPTTIRVNAILRIHTPRNGIRIIIIEVVVQLAVAAAELLLLQEQRVVHQRQGVEDVEFVLLG